MGSRSGLRRGSLSAVTEQVGSELLSRLAEQSHIVQFYESEDNLCGLVADYLAAGLTAGDGLVVIATEGRRGILRERLQAQGIDVDHAAAQGRVRFMDARETLASLMVDAMPDWERFERVVGGEIDLRRGGNRARRVRAYGEMVDLLWRDGNEKGAIQLEEMWNRLGKANPVSLLCAYVMGSFYKEGHDGGHPATLHQLCSEQAADPPAPPRSPGPTARRARRLAAEIEHRKEVEKALRGSLQDLRRAEHALRDSRAELQDFVDNAAEGMEWLDPDGTVLWANRAQLELLGFGEAEYVGRHVSDFHVDREAVDGFLASLARADTVRDHEARVRCQGGAIKHLLINANVYRKDGEIVHTRCFTRDITARKRAHDALMRLQAITASLSEARTQEEVLDVVTRTTIATSGALGASVYLVSPDGRSLELARAVGYAERVIDRAGTVPLDGNLPLAEAARRAVPLFLHHGELSERYPGFEDSTCPSGARALARLPLLVDGRAIGVLGVSHGEQDAFGENEQAFLIALAHQCAQALERARLYDAESRARRTAEAGQHRSAFLSKAGAILSSSLDYEATLTNLARLAVPRIADWCLVELACADHGSQLVVADGDPAQVARLRELRARFPPDREAPVGVARVLATGRSELHREFSDALLASFASDSEHQGFLCRLNFRSAIIVPMTARGRTLGVIALITAASDRRFEQADLDMAEELGHRAAIAIDNARLYQEAREADRRKDEFLAMLGHELRNPLAPIMTGLKLMQLRGIGGDRERQIIERQVKYLVHLVDDLLDVSRITRGKVELNREPVELATVMSKAIEMASPLYEERAHELSVDVARQGLLVEADPMRLAQILANLLTNAAKYTDPHGRVAVSARRENGHVVISVVDSGMGISPSVLPHIFDMFVQGDRALDRSQGGLGIGLTLARSLVEAHGGTISAHSAGLGTGSEFTVRLPTSTGRAATERDIDGAPEPAVKPSGMRVLVVDDNTDAADILADVLRAAGHEVAVAYDGPQALGVARSFEPDAALLDIGLPVLDGYELAERLRELLAARPLRLIAVTGYGQETDKDRSREAGFDAHLVKPIDVRGLVAMLDRPAGDASL